MADKTPMESISAVIAFPFTAAFTFFAIPRAQKRCELKGIEGNNSSSYNSNSKLQPHLQLQFHRQYHRHLETEAQRPQRDELAAWSSQLHGHNSSTGLTSRSCLHVIDCQVNRLHRSGGGGGVGSGGWPKVEGATQRHLPPPLAETETETECHNQN